MDVLATLPASVKQWKSFVAGMGAMLVTDTVALWDWQMMYRPDPLQTQLAATLAPLPSALTLEQLQGLQQQSLPAEPGVRNSQQQLERLTRLPPDWLVSYGESLVQQALTLWSEEAKPLANRLEEGQVHDAQRAEIRGLCHEAVV